LIETRVNKIAEDIKKLVLEYLEDQSEDKKLKLSSHITRQIHYDYSYLSDLFSCIEGTTIEQFFILQRIEKVKELWVYGELSLTEISYQTGFSSVHHLSTQFKK
jgi:AraC family transcriptional regulator